MWDDKPYNSLNFFLKNKFGCKVAKISIDAGFTCPNRDGTISHNGCIFCSEQGSGDFAESRLLSVSNQISIGKEQTAKKWPDAKYIAYFQAFTNTYAPVSKLKSLYYEALENENIIGIAIATRPDCIDKDILALLSEINKKTFLWVELGLQTSNEATAKLINRGYTNSVFIDTLKLLKSENINTVAHVILGIPNETTENMLNTIYFLGNLPIDGIKIHLLHVLKNTPLENIFKETNFHIMSQDEYIDLVIQCIMYLPENVVIHRITGDGNKENLVTPLWSANKRNVLNGIHKKMRETGSFQGKKHDFNIK